MVLATAMSIATVPLPATMKGCELGVARHTDRIRSNDRPKASMHPGETWLGGGTAKAC
jgi:hypothetical protein